MNTLLINGAGGVGGEYLGQTPFLFDPKRNLVDYSINEANQFAALAICTPCTVLSLESVPTT